MGTASAAAIGAMAEKPETFSKSLIYIVFIEAIAIYGLVIAFMIMMVLTIDMHVSFLMHCFLLMRKSQG